MRATTLTAPQKHTALQCVPLATVLVPSPPPAPSPKLPPGVSAPKRSILINACVDSKATFWVVPSSDLLCRVTNANPQLTVETADGFAPVEAIGDICVSMLTMDGTWRSFAVQQVLVLKNCSAVLYSTRTMRDHLGHTVGKVRAGTGSPKMAFEEASRLLNPFWRDGSTPLAQLSTTLVQRAWDRFVRG